MIAAASCEWSCDWCHATEEGDPFELPFGWMKVQFDHRIEMDSEIIADVCAGCLNAFREWRTK